MKNAITKLPTDHFRPVDPNSLQTRANNVLAAIHFLSQNNVPAATTRHAIQACLCCSMPAIQGITEDSDRHRFGVELPEGTDVNSDGRVTRDVMETRGLYFTKCCGWSSTIH